jgi:hypothetical protein
MPTSITFFPVDCGDMTLIVLGDKQGTTILIDCKIREAADDTDNKEVRDVAKDLRGRLRRDSKGRPFVDAFLLSHPDKDHCTGVEKHFHLASPKDYADDEKPDDEKKILIREIWSSPLVFRRASNSHTLCADARAFNTEAKRRVKVNRDAKFKGVGDGNRILVFCEDEDGKTDDLGPILVKLDESFSVINGAESKVFKALLLAPLPKSDVLEEEETLSKNESSVILNIELADSESRKTIRNFLTGGDAEVAIWERLWEKYKKAPSVLTYDLLQTPHHCSWHSLSYDSWSEKKEKGVVSKAAKSALSQIREGGKIVSSSAAIKDDDNDPPCIGAKREYVKIVEGVEGKFYCTGEYPTESELAPLELSITEAGGLELTVHKAAVGPLKSLTRPAIAATGLTFPDKPIVPNKPAGFA